METDVPARPRPWLLIGLALAVGLAGAVQFWPTKPAVSAPASSNPRRPAVKAAEAIGPADLDVRLDALKTKGPDAAGTGRNPFRFQPKAPPPASPQASLRPPPQPDVPAVPPGPPPPPPVPLKFIGTVEPRPGDRVAAFSDCRYTFRGREGDIIDGRYRLVKIGVESVVMEYVDGRGRMTIRLSGQDCIAK